MDSDITSTKTILIRKPTFRIVVKRIAKPINIDDAWWCQPKVPGGGFCDDNNDCLSGTCEGLGSIDENKCAAVTK